MTIIDIHSRLANTALLYAVILCLWGLWRFFRKQNIDSSYWGALVIAEVLLLTQVILGAYLWLSKVGRLSGAVHILYGVVSLMVIPGIYLYTRGDDRRRAGLIYGLGFLFLVGIIMRAMITAR